MTTLRLSINYFALAPGVQTNDNYIEFSLYNSPKDESKGANKAQWKIDGPLRVPIQPGVVVQKEFTVGVPLDNLWLAVNGQTKAQGSTTLFVAGPADISDPNVDQFVPPADWLNLGPPWIPLKTLALGHDVMGTLWHVDGPYLTAQTSNRNLLGSLSLALVVSVAPSPPSSVTVKEEK